MGTLTPIAATTAGCKCGICAYVPTLEADDRALFTSWVEDANLPATELSRHLARQKPQIFMGADVILRWRRGESTCRRG